MVILCAFILGILIAIYIKTLNPQKVYITLEEKKNLEHKIEIENTQEATKLIMQYPHVFHDYEISKGNMDDVFLAVTGNS